MRPHDRVENRDETINTKNIRAPKPLTPEQEAIQHINEIILELPKTIDAKLRPPKTNEEETSHIRENDLRITWTDGDDKGEKPKWTAILDQITIRTMVTKTDTSLNRTWQEPENLKQYQYRRDTSIEKIRSLLWEEHIKALVSASRTGIRDAVDTANTKIQDNINSLTDKTANEKAKLLENSKLDYNTIMEQANRAWFGAVTDKTTGARDGGTVNVAGKKAIEDRLTEATKNNFDLLIRDQNHGINVDKWVLSVTTLEDSELKKIIDSKVLSLDGQTFVKDLRIIQSKLLTCALTTGCVAAGGISLGAVFPGGVGALSTGIGTVLCTGLVYKAWDLSRDFRDRLKTIWDTTANQLHKPANMDAARAWAGLFFKVIRDFNPIPSNLQPDSTDYWAKTPDSKVEAVLNSVKAGAKYASDITYEKHMAKSPEKPLLAVATDEKFGTYIERVSTELSNLRDRWRSLPSFYQGVTIATTVFSAFTFVGHLSKFLQP